MSPWQTTTGDVSQTTTSTAFDGGKVATLDPTAAGDLAIISQLFQVGRGSHLHISFSTKTVVADPSQLTAEIQFYGSANVGLPLLRTDTVFVKEVLFPAEVWQTAVVATKAKPSGTVWARIRFIAEGVGTNHGPVDVDNVVVTAENPVTA